MEKQRGTREGNVLQMAAMTNETFQDRQIRVQTRVFTDCFPIILAL